MAFRLWHKTGIKPTLGSFKLDIYTSCQVQLITAKLALSLCDIENLHILDFVCLLPNF